MGAEVRRRDGRFELVVAGLVIAVEGGFLHDATLIEEYKKTEQEQGIPGAGRYWTPVLLRYAARVINAEDRTMTVAAPDRGAEIRRAYLDKKKK